MSGAHVLNVTIYGDRFVPRDFSPEELRAIVHGLQSDRLADGSWETSVVRRLREEGGALVRRADDTTLTIDIPRDVGYDTYAPEAISISLPGSVLVSNQRTVVLPAFTIGAAGGSALLSGSLLTHNSEAAVRSEVSYHLEVTLRADRWIETLNADAAGVAAVRELLAGLRVTPLYLAGQQLPNPEPSGWDAVVQAALTPQHVVRRDETRLTIALPQCLNYDIGAPETIELTVPPPPPPSLTSHLLASLCPSAHAHAHAHAHAPYNFSEHSHIQLLPWALQVPASALVSRREIVADMSASGLVILAERGEVRLSGALLGNSTEAHVRGGSELRLTLSGDQWSADVGAADNAPTRALLSGLRSAQSEPLGWNRVVRTSLTHTDVDRLDDVSLRIRVAAPEYDIATPETIALMVPSPPPVLLSTHTSSAHHTSPLLPTAQRTRTRTLSDTHTTLRHLHHTHPHPSRHSHISLPHLGGAGALSRARELRHEHHRRAAARAQPGARPALPRGDAVHQLVRGRRLRRRAQPHAHQARLRDARLADRLWRVREPQLLPRLAVDPAERAAEPTAPPVAAAALAAAAQPAAPEPAAAVGVAEPAASVAAAAVAATP